MGKKYTYEEVKEYIESFGYKLLEIWYWDYDNIEEILRRVTNDE